MLNLKSHSPALSCLKPTGMCFCLVNMICCRGHCKISKTAVPFSLGESCPTCWKLGDAMQPGRLHHSWTAGFDVNHMCRITLWSHDDHMIKGSGLHGSCFHLHLSVEFSSEVSRLQRASAGNEPGSQGKNVAQTTSVDSDSDWTSSYHVLECFNKDVTWCYIISMFSMLTCLKYVNVTLLWYYDCLCLWLWLWGRVASCTSTKMPQAILTPDCAIPHHDTHKAVQCECQSMKTAGFWDATGKAERLR